ncbi:MAG TPA: hypothetical protein PK760_11185 [Flavobacteriales bacterium]|nr:hypothetical protein [Flavobacteriales bacterium]
MLVVAMAACRHEPPDAPQDQGTGGGGYSWTPPPDTMSAGVVCDPDTVYFEQAVLPLLVNYCATAGCHDAITHEEGVRLYDYAHIMQQVTAGHPNQSDLMTDGIWETGNDQMPPSDQPQMTQAQINTITTWINQGAQNNSCVPSACDTTNVTFSGTIAPIMSTFCTGCHGGSSPDGNINLTSHAGVVAVANDGRLMGSVRHQATFSSMPPVGGGLSACRIAQLQKWVNEGAQNN